MLGGMRRECSQQRPPLPISAPLKQRDIIRQKDRRGRPLGRTFLSPILSTLSTSGLLCSRWPWYPSTSALPSHCRRQIGKTRPAEARLRQIVSKYGVPPAAARNLQSAIVQDTMLYASELTRKGQKSVEDEHQLVINRIGGATLGAFQSTPRGIIAGVSGLTPVRALLNHRQARCPQRL